MLFLSFVFIFFVSLPFHYISFLSVHQFGKGGNAVEDGEGNQKSWADDLPDDTPNAQSIMEDRELLCALYQKLQELDPEGRRICELIMEGKSERDIASIMGYNNQSAVNYRKQKAFDRLRVLLGDYI